MFEIAMQLLLELQDSGRHFTENSEFLFSKPEEKEISKSPHFL